MSGVHFQNLQLVMDKSTNQQSTNKLTIQIELNHLTQIISQIQQKNKSLKRLQNFRKEKQLKVRCTDNHKKKSIALYHLSQINSKINTQDTEKQNKSK